MGALLLAETGPLAGVVGGAYAATLGFALVYLGEHYVVDLVAGLALTLAVRRCERIGARPVRAVGALVDRIARFAAGVEDVEPVSAALRVRPLGPWVVRGARPAPGSRA